MATLGQQTWGFENWGTLGDAVVTLSSTNLSATTSIGTATAEGILQVGWGGDTWGENTWGDLSGAFANPTGIQATYSVGSVTTTANANIDVTGIQLTATNSGAVGGTSVDLILAGQELQTFFGEETIGIGVNVTGISLTPTSGTVTIDDNFLIGSGWGRDAWGSMVWGDAYSVQTGSVSATMSIGAVAEIIADANVELTGQQLQTEIGEETITADGNVDVTGIQATLSVGQVQGLSVVGSQMTMSTQTVDIEAGGNVSVNPIEDNLDSFIGSVTLDIGVTPAAVGSEATMSISGVTTTANANVNITGLALTSSIGEETAFTDVVVSVTGQELTSSIGEETVQANADVSVTGSQLTSSIGSVEQNTIYDVTGLEMTMSIGEETPIANANVDVTGIALTGSIGSVNTTAWQEINLGVNNVWTEVDLAA